MPPLRRQLEKALATYLQANAATLGSTSDRIVQAGSQNEPEIPYLIVAVGKGEAHPELAQVQTLPVTLHLRTAASKGGDERDTADQTMSKVHSFLMQPEDPDAQYSDSNPEAGTLLASLNKPAEDPDPRPVKPLHLYLFTPMEDVGDTHEEGWEDQLTYSCIAQPMDSH